MDVQFTKTTLKKINKDSSFRIVKMKMNTLNFFFVYKV